MEKMTIKIPETTLEQSINYFEGNPEIYKCIKALGFKTVRDVVRNQSQVPSDIMAKIKGKLVFNLDL